jgi:hypothetical protein
MAAAGLRPYPTLQGGGNSGLDSAFMSGRGRLRPEQEKGLSMKHITGTALAVACFAAIGAALLAGKDDIRKFRRMRSM